MEKKREIIIKKGATLYGKNRTVETKKDVSGIFIKSLKYGACGVEIKGEKFRTDYTNIVG
jgi:hypothetical protein